MSHRDSVVAPPEGAVVDRGLALDADRRVRAPRAAALRRPVPPRGGAHAARAGPAEELPLRGRRRAAGVDARGRDRGAGRADPRAGRPRARPLRALRRRRLRGRGAARAQGGRRPAHVRLRRPRLHARRTRPSRSSRRSRGHFHVPLVHVAGAGAVPRAARGRRGPGGEAHADRRGVHPRLRGGGAEARRRPPPRPGDALLGRDRVGRHGRASRRRSRRTTTSAGCRPTCGWSSSSRCACSSRTRCGASARSSGCPSGWSGGSRSRARASRSGSSARSPSERLDDAAGGRRDPPGGGAPRRPLPRAVAVVRRAARDPLGRRPGRRAHVRVPDRDPRGDVARTR